MRTAAFAHFILPCPRDTVKRRADCHDLDNACYLLYCAPVSSRLADTTSFNNKAHPMQAAAETQAGVLGDLQRRLAAASSSAQSTADIIPPEKV